MTITAIRPAGEVTITPPHNQAAEEAVIGAILLDPEIFGEIGAVLQKGAEEFYIHRYRFVWEAFQRLADRRSEIDIITVADELEANGKLDEVGGMAFLMGLLTATPTTLHAEDHARIVSADRLRRDMLAAANRIASLAYDESVDAIQAASNALATMTEAASAIPSGSMRDARQLYSALYDRVAELSQQPADVLPGIKTGFVELDRGYLSGGLKNGHLVYIGARPGEGKSSLSEAILYHAAFEQRKRVALFSLEMPGDEIVGRLVAMEQEINTQEIETGKLSEDNWPKFVQAVETGAEMPFWIDDDPYLTPAILRSKCLRLRATRGLDAVIVDYIGLMETDRHRENRIAELTEISRLLKRLAGELKIPVVGLLQLNREVEKRGDPEPQLSDLRDTGAFEQDANVVAFVYRDKDPGMHNVSHVKVAKNRGGPTGIIDLLFRREYVKFYSLLKYEAQRPDYTDDY